MASMASGCCGVGVGVGVAVAVSTGVGVGVGVCVGEGIEVGEAVVEGVGKMEVRAAGVPVGCVPGAMVESTLAPPLARSVAAIAAFNSVA
jgi:hypothetical protein